MSWQNSWIASCSRQCSSNQNYAFIFFMKKAIAVSFRVVMAIIGPIMLTCANVLIFGVMFVFVNFILPKLTENSPIAYILHLSFGVFLFVNVVFNYWCCAFTSPGYPTQCESPESLLGQSTVMMEGRRVVVLRNKFEISPAVSYRYCRHCQCIKPPRAHHDSVCGKCVLHMDHFCPWMNNCVGFFNYRYFVLFLLYLFVGCFYGVIITFQPFFSMTIRQRNRIYGFDDNSMLVGVFTLALAAGISVGILLVWHIYLVLTNQTTIEVYINFDEAREARKQGQTYKNPFDKGWRKNLRRVFGDVPWYSAAMLSLRPPPLPEYPVDFATYLETEGITPGHV